MPNLYLPTASWRLIIPALLGLAACSSFDPKVCDYAAFRLQVTQIPALAFAWSPARCPVYAVELYDQSNRRVWWHQAPYLQARILPPIRFSLDPPYDGAPPFDPLIVGATYRAALVRAIPQTLETETVSTVTFTYSAAGATQAPGVDRTLK